MDQTLAELWQSHQTAIESALASALPSPEEASGSLSEAMAYSLLAGGKRLRPVLLLMSCQACGGAVEAALPAACAVEMVHTYSLIHDDLPAMDDDDLRRGRPTSHKVFGEAVAILAGDALLTRAFELVAWQIAPPSLAAECVAELAAAGGADGMVGGQVLDLEAEENPPDPGEEAAAQLETIHRRKTAALIACSASLGGRIAGADEARRQSLARYGEAIGLAFQITDDLLDVLGSDDKMGKGIGKDASRGKLTYPGLLGVEESQARAERLIETARGEAETLGAQGEPLAALARFVLERDH